MNEVGRIYKSLFLLSLLFGNFICANLRTKGDYLVSDLKPNKQSQVVRTPNIAHEGDIDSRTSDFHKVFTVKTNYSNTYSPGSPLINGRNPELITAANKPLRVDGTTVMRRIPEFNNPTYYSSEVRPVPPDPFMKNKNYNNLVRTIQTANPSSVKAPIQTNHFDMVQHGPQRNYQMTPRGIPQLRGSLNYNQYSSWSHHDKIFPRQVPTSYYNRFYTHRRGPIIGHHIDVIHSQQRPQSAQRVYNPMPVMTHYNMPILHHIPVNQLVRRYVPVYYPVPIEHRINVPVQIPIKVPQRVLIPQAVPFGVKIPVPIPVRVEIPQYKEFQVQKPVYVKIPIYEHIPVYHHFAMTEKQKPVSQSENPDDCDEDQTISNENKQELNKQLQNYLKKNGQNLQQ